MSWLIGKKRIPPPKTSPKAPPPRETDEERDARERAEAAQELRDLMARSNGLYFPQDTAWRSVARMRPDRNDQP